MRSIFINLIILMFYFFIAFNSIKVVNFTVYYLCLESCIFLSNCQISLFLQIKVGKT